MKRLTNYRLLFLTVVATIATLIKLGWLAVLGKYTRSNIDKVARRWAERLLAIVQAKVTIHDPYQLTLTKGKVYMIMSNHLSHYDIPLIFTLLPGSVRMLAKQELFRIPLWGAAMRKAEIMSIDRDNFRKALQDLAKAQAKMLSGVILWVAPEGTRSRTGELQAFKKGGFWLALKTQATIIPVGIVGSNNILPPHTLNFQVGAHIKITIGQPIDVTQYTTPKQLMVDVKESIAQAILD